MIRPFLIAFLLLPCAAFAGKKTIEGTVTKVYDGDTVVMQNEERVRVRWINTPERRPVQAYADEAKRFVERLVLNRKVRLHLDPENERDGYGRLIASVQIGETDLSLALIEGGLAHVFIIPPEPYDITHLLTAQEMARKRRRGIWSNRRYVGDLHITSFHNNAPGDDRENVNGEYLRICNISNGPVDLSRFTIENYSGKKWKLPAVEIPAGHTIKLHSGVGVAQTDPSRQLTAHIGSRVPIWENDGDRATLIDENGRRIDVEATGDKR